MERLALKEHLSFDACKEEVLGRGQYRWIYKQGMAIDKGQEKEEKC